MRQEILRIKTEGKSVEFLKVLAHFKQHLSTNPKSCRAYITCFMQGMFFYDKPTYLYRDIVRFHKLSVENELNTERYEYLLITYKEAE